ncbi:Qat anti-phage system QueC-like protein QatC [Marinibaculum pumilum]|uniref:Qat anti-phage system QueC-like protein QatC n=1 Tax=Marinibaculum pumilum TaxID=1766165 RepID=A0ABV7L3C6_9PROT
MKMICAPEDQFSAPLNAGDLAVHLYGPVLGAGEVSIGATARHVIQRRKWKPAAHAWDFLSIALSIIAADTAVRRDLSPDGWTRQIELEIAVGDPDFWNSQRELLARQLQFLTTDIWTLTFRGGGILPVPPKKPNYLDQDCAVLLSGGLDSLIGTLDLCAEGKKPFAVSQVSTGDKQTQKYFASQIGGGLGRLQLNHNVKWSSENERSQRARSIIFFAYGVLAATAMLRYHAGKDVTLYVCENGFISINPPLTGSRLGSLSTRTTHPYYLTLLQELFDNAGLRVKLENPCQFLTKGEMIQQCADQPFLTRHAHTSTSCGRYARNGFMHCGRCLPCLIRRAAFHAAGMTDNTRYKYRDLSRDDSDHARYDDVRAAAMGVAALKAEGLNRWAGPALSATLLGDPAPYQGVVQRGMDELGAFLSASGVT